MQNANGKCVVSTLRIEISIQGLQLFFFVTWHNVFRRIVFYLVVIVFTFIDTHEIKQLPFSELISNNIFV